MVKSNKKLIQTYDKMKLYHHYEVVYISFFNNINKLQYLQYIFTILIINEFILIIHYYFLYLNYIVNYNIKVHIAHLK